MCPAWSEFALAEDEAQSTNEMANLLINNSPKMYRTRSQQVETDTTPKYEDFHYQMHPSKQYFALLHK
jgi:hypothetical protein